MLHSNLNNHENNHINLAGISDFLWEKVKRLSGYAQEDLHTPYTLPSAHTADSEHYTPFTESPNQATALQYAKSIKPQYIPKAFSAPFLT